MEAVTDKKQVWFLYSSIYCERDDWKTKSVREVIPGFLCTLVCTNAGSCTSACPQCVCVCGVESGRCADACAYAWIVSRSTLCHRPPSDLTPAWTLPRPRSIRIVYPTPSPPSRLMHGGVKHLIMLNHSGAQHASNYPEWQHMAREMAGRGKKCHIALREWEKGRGGGGGGGVRVAEGEERTRGVECLEKKNQG